MWPLSDSARYSFSSLCRIPLHVAKSIFSFEQRSFCFHCNTRQAKYQVPKARERDNRWLRKCKSLSASKSRRRRVWNPQLVAACIYKISKNFIIKIAFRLSEKPPYFFTPTLAWDIHILLITLPKISSDGFSEKWRVNSEKVKISPNFVRGDFCDLFPI